MVTPNKVALRRIDDELIRQVTRTIVERFHPRKVLLFGSYARGTAGPDSDLDLIVEMESDKPWYQRIVDMQSVFATRDWAMDILVFTPEEMERERNFSAGWCVLLNAKARYSMSASSPSYREWIAKADSDFAVIEITISVPRPPWDAICFHAEQAAEKYLKAFLAYAGQDPPRTHDLPALLRACRGVEPKLPDLESDCLLLTPYVAASRYPGVLPEPDRNVGEAAVAAARRISAAIHQRLAA